MLNALLLLKLYICAEQRPMKMSSNLEVANECKLYKDLVKCN